MWLSETEYQHLCEQKTRSGLTQEQYLRDIIMGRAVQAKPCAHYPELLRQISGLCNNINQTARIANTYHEVSSHQMVRLQQQADEIWKLVKQW